MDFSCKRERAARGAEKMSSEDDQDEEQQRTKSRAKDTEGGRVSGTISLKVL